MLFLQKENGISSIDHYNDLRKRNLNWTSNDTSITSHELFNMATYSFDDIVKSIKARTVYEDDKGEFKSTALDMDEKHNSIVEQRHRRFGRCYTYCPETPLKELGIYYLSIIL